MSLKELEARVAELEKQVRVLMPEPSTKPDKEDWKRTIGMFAGDEFMQGVMEEASRFREQDRRKTRPVIRTKAKR